MIREFIKRNLLLELVLLMGMSFISGVNYGYKRAARLVVNPEVQRLERETARAEVICQELLEKKP